LKRFWGFARRSHGLKWATALGLILTLLPATAHAGDPRLRWYTIENDVVRVHFHGGLETIAQRAATVAAQFEKRLVRWLGRRTRERTEIVIEDSSDSANGFAGVLPYSAIHLYATAPDDMSVLGDHDDWFPSLLSHEQTHIVQADNVGGLPALISIVFGKQTAPNQMQPRWLLEGLAVYNETKQSSGGRLRSSLFEMMLRAEVIDDTFAPLDRITGEPRRWPGGTYYYLYGAKFVEFLADLYGEGLFGQVVTDSGDDIIPFAVSRPFYRATGRTIEELYDGFKTATYRRMSEELAAVTARGLREGRRLTFHGSNIANPRFFSKSCNEAEGIEGVRLLYARDDGHERGGFYELQFSGNKVTERLLTRASGDTATMSKDCSILFESTAPSQRRYRFFDLFRQLPHTRAPSGTEPSRQRLTVGRRATDPDISPDGRSVVYVTNRAGTTTLRTAQLSFADTLDGERALVPATTYEQVYTPRFSNDGHWVAYATWTEGGYRDIRLVEVATGRILQVTYDRAIDQQPSFSPDDKFLYFSSDRSGISNIYAYEIKTGQLRQVTNVRTGAFMPEVSPDGKLLAYIGYSSKGYDLFVLELDEATFLEPIPHSALRGDRPTLPDTGNLKVRSYAPWSTLRPRAIEFDYRSDESGQRLIVSTSGSDIVGHHGVSADVVFEPEGNSPDVYLSYGYHRLPFTLGMSAYRISNPNIKYDYGSATSKIVEVSTGATTGISYGIPSEYSAQSVSLSYRAQDVRSDLPTGVRADPYGTVPEEPRRGVDSSVRLSYSFSNVESTAYGSGAERGLSMNLTVDESHRGLGSELEGTTVTGHTTGYVLLPWSRHHVLALSNFFGASTGSAGSGFSLGGYQDSNLLRNMIEGIGQSRVTLRGYPSGRFRGSRALLGQFEYRAPLLEIDRGISTLPVFVRCIHGALGLDAGGAFDKFDENAWEKQFHYGVSAELWFDLVLSYRMSSRVLFGYAVGRGDGAIEGGTSYIIVGSGL
jgi:hypothetical protein